MSYLCFLCREVSHKEILIFNWGRIETRLYLNPTKVSVNCLFAFLSLFVGFSLHSGTQKECSSSWTNIQQRETRTDLAQLTCSQVHKSRDCTWDSVRFLDSDTVRLGYWGKPSNSLGFLARGLQPSRYHSRGMARCCFFKNYSKVFVESQQYVILLRIKRMLLNIMCILIEYKL